MCLSLADMLFSMCDVVGMQGAAVSIVVRVSQKAGCAGPGCVVVRRGTWGTSAWDAGAMGL